MSQEMVQAQGQGNTDLATTEYASALAGLNAAQHVNSDAFDAMVRGNYLPRVQICGGSSNLVSEGKMGVGKFAFVQGKDDFVDFGDSIECVPISHRFAALRFGTDKTESCYDPNSPVFKKIQADSEEPDSGCSYGPQFLVYLPRNKEFATFLFGSKSARPEARKMAAQMGKPTVVKAKLVSNNKNKWFVPVVLPSSTGFDMPTLEKAQGVAAIFNACGEETEPAETTGGDNQPAATGSEERVR